MPEQIAGNLVNGQSVDAEIAALAGIKIQGHLSFVSATVNPETAPCSPHGPSQSPPQVQADARHDGAARSARTQARSRPPPWCATAMTEHVFVSG
ncbi:MAG: hypothetical protein R2762_16335 [Bryobacteraceae bacterium]